MDIRDIKINSDTYPLDGLRKPVILWENESPTTSFTAQTVTIPNVADAPPTSDFRYFVVGVNFSTAAVSQDYFFGEVGGPSIVCHGSTIHSSSSTSSHIYRRLAKVTSDNTNNLSFSDCKRVNASTTTDNDNLIPFIVYGIY